MKASRLGTLVAVFLLSACASTSKMQSRAASAATTPLNDLNLVREEIPEVLQSAVKAPYQSPADKACPALVAEIHLLDGALGADLDAPDSDNSPSLRDRGTDAAENAAIGAIQRTAEGFVPFRGWIRKLTGAESHSRKLAAAVTAGSVRRAFLKGVALSQSCVITPPPAVAAAPASAPGAAGASTPPAVTQTASAEAAVPPSNPLPAASRAPAPRQP